MAVKTKARLGTANSSITRPKLLRQHATECGAADLSTARAESSGCFERLGWSDIRVDAVNRVKFGANAFATVTFAATSFETDKAVGAAKAGQNSQKCEAVNSTVVNSAVNSGVAPVASAIDAPFMLQWFALQRSDAVNSHAIVTIH